MSAATDHLYAPLGHISDRLRDNGIRLRDYSEGDHKTTCPRCSHARRKKSDPCLSVKVDDADGAAWNCWHCGWTGNLPGEGASRQPAPKPVRRPDPPKEVSRDDKMFSWFEGRGISRGVVEALGIYARGEGQRREIVFPYRHRGELVNNKYRGHPKRFCQDKDAARTFYNIDAVGEASEVVIAEGEMDVLSLLEAGFESVISLPDGAPATGDSKGDRRYEALRTCEDDIAHVERFILATDADGPGQNLRAELARRLGRDRCAVVNYPEGCKDANEVLQRHGADRLRQCIEDARPYPISGLYSFRDYQAEILRLYRDGTEPWVSTGWKGANPFIRVPAERGLLWIVTGVPNSGKSEWLDALFVNLAKAEGWAIGYCSFENPPEQHAPKLLAKYAERPFWDGPSPRMSEAEVSEALAFIERHFPLLRAEDESPTVGWLLERMAALVRGYGVRAVVIDPYNEIEHKRGGSQTETEYVSDLLSKLRRFANAYDCHVFLVAHPAKLKRNEGGGIPTPTLYDISGSAHFVNKADFGLVVERDMETGRTLVHVRKCRWGHLGQLGEVEFEYDKATGCYDIHRKVGLS